MGFQLFQELRINSIIQFRPWTFVSDGRKSTFLLQIFPDHSARWDYILLKGYRWGSLGQSIWDNMIETVGYETPDKISTSIFDG